MITVLIEEEKKKRRLFLHTYGHTRNSMNKMIQARENKIDYKHVCLGKRREEKDQYSGQREMSLSD